MESGIRSYMYLYRSLPTLFILLKVPKADYELPLGKADILLPGTDITLIGWGTQVSLYLGQKTWMYHCLLWSVLQIWIQSDPNRFYLRDFLRPLWLIHVSAVARVAWGGRPGPGEAGRFLWGRWPSCKLLHLCLGARVAWGGCPGPGEAGRVLWGHWPGEHPALGQGHHLQ